MSTVAEPRRTGQPTRPSLPRESSPEASDQIGSTFPSLRALPRKTLLIVLIVGCVFLVVSAVSMLVSGLGNPEQTLILYATRRGDLPITVTERGNLESQDNIEIICEVDDIRGDGIEGTPIIWIIGNGSSVEEGDLLVELDSAPHRERLDQQVLDTEKARAEKISAKAIFENQKSQNVTTEADAKLQVKLAELELEMFKDEDNGTHKLEVEEINRLIDDVNNDILTTQASLELKRNAKHGIESLFKLGYAGKRELDQSRLDFLQAEHEYAAKMNRLVTHQATLAKKQTYEREMQLLQLQGNVETAKRNLEQARLNNQALLEQAQATMDGADRGFEKEQERHARYEEQLEKCKIYAPQDGMVAYSSSSSRGRRVTIGEGALIRERQRILSLPNLKKMQVKTAVHESVLDQIQTGLSATVRVDAFPDVRYKASVQSVAVLPDQDGWMSSDIKVYETVIVIDEEVGQLKPGMTAVVEIHVDRLTDVISVPVQAIVQIDRQSWCYIDDGGTPRRCLVELGRTNDKYVEIRSGLGEGEQVVLNPMAILEQSEREDSPGTTEEDGSIENPEEDQLESQPADTQGNSPEVDL